MLNDPKRLPMVIKLVDEFIVRVRSYSWDHRKAAEDKEAKMSPLTMKVLARFLAPE
ncbi:MAG: hypothetical protein NWE89_03035 [Candidatus Bathyarchaeota archaeon]|nr:hypothetical protein [Candidatus Bathyarchaeota archaeon]